MNDQVYQDAKAALENLASKVPGTWELLVRENANYALWSIILGVTFFVLLGALGYALLRDGLKRGGMDSEGEPALYIGGALIGCSILMILIIVGANLGTVCAPNITTAKELLGRGR